MNFRFGFMKTENTNGKKATADDDNGGNETKNDEKTHEEAENENLVKMNE